MSINVSDVDAAVTFCSRLWMSPRAGPRLDAGGVDTDPKPGAVCCYARQDKVWVLDPDGMAWEYCTVLEHTETA